MGFIQKPTLLNYNSGKGERRSASNFVYDFTPDHVQNISLGGLSGTGCIVKFDQSSLQTQAQLPPFRSMIFSLTDYSDSPPRVGATLVIFVPSTGQTFVLPVGQITQNSRTVSGVLPIIAAYPSEVTFGLFLDGANEHNSILSVTFLDAEHNSFVYASDSNFTIS